MDTPPTVTTLSFEELLQRLEGDLLTEPCSYCGTRHPRFAIQGLERGQEPVTVSGLAGSLQATEQGRGDLATLVEFDGTRLFDPDTHLPYAGVIDRAVELPYTCAQRMEQARVDYEEAMGRTDRAFVSKLKLALAMLAPDYDWAQHWRGERAPSLETLLRECCIVEYVNGRPDTDEGEQGGHIPKKGCGSTVLEDTPRALYRLLYLFRPSPLRLRDMYDQGLVEISTPDRRFSVSVRFHRYELALYWYAESALVHDPQAGYAIRFDSGIPGTGDRMIAHEEGLLFFALVKAALSTPWSVYPGNSFEV